MTPERAAAPSSTLEADGQLSGSAAKENDSRPQPRFLVMAQWDEIDERGRRTRWAAPKIFDDEHAARTFRARALSGLIAGPRAVDLEVGPVVPVPRRVA